MLWEPLMDRSFCRVIIFAIALFGAVAQAAVNQLTFDDSTITRYQASKRAARVDVMLPKIDAYLAATTSPAEAAESDENLPLKLTAIIQQGGFDEFDFNDQWNEALSIFYFDLCGGNYTSVTARRRDWGQRLYAILRLTQSEESEELSAAQWTKIDAQAPELLHAWFDSLLTKFAMDKGCAPQALAYLDSVTQAATAPVAKAYLQLNQAGARLAQAGKASELPSILALRREALRALLVELTHLQSWLGTIKEVADEFGGDAWQELIEILRDYDAEFSTIVQSNQTPAWRVDKLAAPRTRPRMRCGTMQWMAIVFRVGAFPHLPTAADYLRASGQDDALLAYWLAETLDARQQLSIWNRSFSFDMELFDPAWRDKVWAMHGKTRTMAELEFAAATITLSAAENGVAIVRLFGQEFQLESGEDQFQEGTRWYSKQEIIDEFKRSDLYLLLTGQDLESN
jgi:hypothetical protein